ncbi:MAG: serine/threonine-protein phosphatase [Clostridia bacterium]|nr:serine/threonine-protein phosphatase [Clostridia bacterium]
MTLMEFIRACAIRILLSTTAVFLLTTLVFLITTIVLAAKYRKVLRRGSESFSLAAQPLCFDVALLQNQGKREYQQDSFYLSDQNDSLLVSEKGLLAVVADGMGGLQDGKAISSITVDTFKKQFNACTTGETQKFLSECVYQAESAVDAYMYASSMKGGSTVVATLIRGGKLSFVSVGDSSIFLVRNNEVKLLNRYHNYASVLSSKVRQGMISQQEADNDPMRSRITSYIGMGEVNEIDANTQPIALRPDDVLILCSDGVANALGNDALLKLINAGSFSELGTRIEENILRQDLQNQDNFTAVMIKCKTRLQ